MSVDGCFIHGFEGVGRSLHALEFPGFGLGNQSKLVEAQSPVNGALAHGDVVLLATGEIRQREGFNVSWNKTYLSVDGAAGFQLFVIVAADGVQDVGVNMADRERVIEDGRVEDEADLRISCSFDIGDAGQVEDGVGHRFVVGFVHRYHNVKVANGVLSPSCTAGKGGPVNAVQGGNFSLKGLAIAQTDVETATGPEPREQFDAVQHALL